MDPASPVEARQSSASSTHRAFFFLRAHPLRVLLISAALAIPCLWTSHPGTGDFPSHVYNAWLYPQVARGEIPGVATQNVHTNLVTDVALTWGIERLGLMTAQRLVLWTSV